MPVKLTTDDVQQVAQATRSRGRRSTTPLDPRVAYQAASFYYDNNKDMKQAAKWVDQAIEKNPNAYFMHYKKAQIQAKLGNKKEATASAQKAIEILKADKAPGRSRDQERAADHRQLEVRIRSGLRVLTAKSSLMLSPLAKLTGGVACHDCGQPALCLCG